MAATAKAILKSPAIKPLTKRRAWTMLKAHHKSIQALHLRELFHRDPKRGEQFTAEALGIYLDFSKNRITDEILKLLLELARESGLRERIDAMFRGEKINITENRAVLHVALRATKDETRTTKGCRNGWRMRLAFPVSLASLWAVRISGNRSLSGARTKLREEKRWRKFLAATANL
jgi:hypothetical protein